MDDGEEVSARESRHEAPGQSSSNTEYADVPRDFKYKYKYKYKYEKDKDKDKDDAAKKKDDDGGKGD